MNDDLATTAVLDSKGSNDGTLEGGNNTEDISVAGKINKALDFDGTDDYINCGNNASLDITDVITLSVWLKWDGAVNGWNDYRVLIYGTDTYRIFGGSVSAGKIHMSIWGSGETWINTPASTTRVDDGEWHHIVGTSDGTTLCLYVDGVLEASIESGTINNLIGNVYIGARATGTSGWNGKIDDVRIYNTALTPYYVKLLYNNGAGTEDENIQSNTLLLGCNF